MSSIRDIDGLLESNRDRALRAKPRRPMRGPDGPPLRARRPKPRRRDGLRVRAARFGLVLAISAFGFGLWQQPVRKISVHGPVLHDVATVRALSSSLRGERWITLDASAVIEAVEGLPWVRSVRVTRELPDAVRIEVEERFPVARALQGETVWGVADDGTAALLPAGVETTALPRIEGLFAEDGTIVDDASSRIAGLVGALREGGWPFASGLRVIDLNAPGGLSLLTGDDVEIRLGLHDTTERIRTAAVAWDHLAPAPGDRIDLRFARQAVLTRAASIGG